MSDTFNDGYIRSGIFRTIRPILLIVPLFPIKVHVHVSHCFV